MPNYSIAHLRWLVELTLSTAKRSKCLRSQVGAVIAVPEMIISYGYNGPAKEKPHCKICRRDDDIISSSNDPMCEAVHAEANAIIYAAKFMGGTCEADMFVTRPPCVSCQRLLVNAEINVVYVYGKMSDKDLDTLANWTCALPIFIIDKEMNLINGRTY